MLGAKRESIRKQRMEWEWAVVVDEGGQREWRDARPGGRAVRVWTAVEID